MSMFNNYLQKIDINSLESLGIMEYLPVGVCIIQYDGIVKLWNACLESWIGISRAKIVNKNLFFYFPHLNSTEYLERLSETFENGEKIIFSPHIYPDFFTSFREDGILRLLQITAIPINISESIGHDILLCVEDMTDSLSICDRYLNDKHLQQNPTKYPQMFEKNRAVQILVDPQTLTIHDVNTAATQFYGYTQETLQQKRLSEITVLADGSPIPIKALKLLKYPGNFLYFHQLSSGEIRNVEVNSSSIKIGDKDFICCIISDITERKQMEEKLKQANNELQRIANIDGLTQISNRRCFDTVINMEWQRLVREKKYLSLILCDIDYFKYYNDFYGHLKGDECLRKVSQAISINCKRPADLVARYGGEEFTILLPNTPLEGAIYFATQIQEKILKLAIPHHRSQVSNYITLSMGITSIIPSKEYDPEYLIKNADLALYSAKSNGRNQFIVFRE